MQENGPGVFVFSLDLELAWGAVHRGGYAGRERDFERTRYVVRELLTLFERHGISATWAVVGHLFLGSCRPEMGSKHPEIVRPIRGSDDSDWFDRDPCTSVQESPFWYAPDLVRMILDCSEPQEVGSHNFSHVIVDENCSAESFASELDACRKTARSWDLDLTSFVFPRNVVSRLDTLAAAGYQAFRGVAPDWTWKVPGPLRRPARLIDAFRPGGVSSSLPVREAGMWNIPASYNYLHRSGWGRLVPISVRVRKAVSGMQDAARRGGVFHLWTHPFNVASDPERLLAGLDQIFNAYADFRDSGLMTNLTMGELARSLDRLETLNQAGRSQPAGATH